MRIIKSYLAILILVLVLNAGSYALRSFWEQPTGRDSIAGRLYEYTAIVVSAAQNLLPHRKSEPDSSLRSQNTGKPSARQEAAPGIQVPPREHPAPGATRAHPRN